MSTTLLLCSDKKTTTRIIQEKLQINLIDNPDLYLINQDNENIKIKEIRKIGEQIIYPPSKSQFKTFILYNFEKTTHPAQNAFLKSLEEHPSYVQFILQCNSLNGVLETVQSRSVIQKGSNHSQNPNLNKEQLSQDWKIISQGSYADIIEMCGTYKDRSEAIQFTTNLIIYLHQNNQSNPNKLVNKSLINLTDCLSHLKQNSNVLLTLENHFFAIKSRF